MKKNIYGLRYLVKHEKPAGSVSSKTVDYTEPANPCQVYDTISDRGQVTSTISGNATIEIE